MHLFGNGPANSKLRYKIISLSTHNTLQSKQSYSSSQLWIPWDRLVVCFHFLLSRWFHILPILLLLLLLLLAPMGGGLFVSIAPKGLQPCCYSRAKDNWKARKELDKAIHIFWDSNKPSPRAFMVDAAIETELVSALKVEDCPVILFIKAGRILHRVREILTADEFAKIMAYFYYGASRPACLKNTEPVPEEVPSLT